jgi:hypothetical protein
VYDWFLGWIWGLRKFVQRWCQRTSPKTNFNGGGKIALNFCNEWRKMKSDWTETPLGMEVPFINATLRQRYRVCNGNLHSHQAPRKRLRLKSIKCWFVSLTAKQRCIRRLCHLDRLSSTSFGRSDTAGSSCEAIILPCQVGPAPRQRALTHSAFRQGVSGENIDLGPGKPRLLTRSRFRWLLPLFYYEESLQGITFWNHGRYSEGYDVGPNNVQVNDIWMCFDNGNNVTVHIYGCRREIIWRRPTTAVPNNIYYSAACKNSLTI